MQAIKCDIPGVQAPRSVGVEGRGDQPDPGAAAVVPAPDRVHVDVPVWGRGRDSANSGGCRPGCLLSRAGKKKNNASFGFFLLFLIF